MTVFDRLARQLLEACNGRITITRGCWVFEIPNNYPPDGPVHRREDATGRPMFLISKKGVHCANPRVGEGTFPQSNSSDHWFVPWAFCHKCQYYRKGGTDGLRYPHCDWVRSRRGSDIGAAREMLGALSDAAEFADNIIKGR